MVTSSQWSAVCINMCWENKRDVPSSSNVKQLVAC